MVKKQKIQAIPFMESPVPAGFPSAVESFAGKALDLQELLIKHPASTYFIRVKGDSMRDAGICSGDILIVDRSLAAAHNQIVIARIADELTVKRISIEKQKVILVPANEAYPAIVISDEMDAEVWGVVTYVIHKT